VRTGIAPHILTEADEKKSIMPGSLLSTFFGLSESFGPDALSSESLYKMQSTVIRNIGMHESCVLVGRTSDYILRDHPRLVSIFMHSPLEQRAQNIISRGEASNSKQAREMAVKADKRRESYYNYFTGRHWGRADNYDITLNSAALTDSQIVDIIISFISQRFK
ncbi:MAG: cytidylate kinase-like family protein, partial [Muribaculum sp.]|nr:cytidylate kinase-like family protein [Muribaculum sp.]